jgi:hypothetical protein
LLADAGAALHREQDGGPRRHLPAQRLEIGSVVLLREGRRVAESGYAGPLPVEEAPGPRRAAARSRRVGTRR